jgi:hypothetical protein
MSFPYPIVGPIAPENNPPIEPQYYEPSRFVITGITLGVNTTITTGVNHNYVVGQQIRLLVPRFYGSYQLSGQTGYVISIPAANQVVVNINSVNVNTYIASPSYISTPPQIMAIGDIISGAINTQGQTNQMTYIPGSFINISPN